MASTRLPGKALVPICGRPLLQRLCNRMALCRRAQEVIVATSDQPQDDAIEECCAQWRVKVFRGPEPDLTTRLLGAVDAFGLSDFVRVTGDNPLTDPEGVEALIAELAEQQRSNGVRPILVHNMHKKGHPYGTGAEASSRSALEYCDGHLSDLHQREYFAAYARTHPRTFHCVKLDSPADLQRPNYFLTVDYKQDLRLIRTIYESVPGGDHMRLQDVIQFLDANPGLAQSSARLHKPFTE